ncbi:2OG-Fe(II) oxygenase [bacterium]|nr:MAG: 2OG-Fe(II) oxygenase [bacterium]
MSIVQHTPSIWTIPHFLSEDECRHLISFAEGFGFEEATVGLSSGARMMKGVRDNFRAEVDDQTLADRLWAQIQPEFPASIEGMSPVGLNPHFRFYRYENGQKFKRHIDGRQKVGELESRVTFMIYLNADFEGGATAFDEVAISPETGTALLFVHELKHEGCPVESGQKYVLRSDVLFGREEAL